MPHNFLVFFAIIAVSILAGENTSGSTITVCSSGCDHTSINTAIDAANDGDVIQLLAETYTEGAVIDTDGKAITILGATDKRGASASILDGDGSHRVLRCGSGEGAGTVFKDLVIRGGFNSDVGGGMYNHSSSPTLINCTFTNNSAEYGGGIINYFGSNPTLTGCTFKGNAASVGGGVYNYHLSAPLLEGCTFTDNSSDLAGGGMFNYDSSPSLVGCGFTGNHASEYGGAGIYNHESSVDGTSRPTLSSSLFCGNTGGNIAGDWIDEGENCIRLVCDDGDGDGLPDCVDQESDLELAVPGEYVSIELAIDAAAPGAVIVIEAGIFTPHLTLDTQGKPITIRGAIDADGGPGTIIDGGGMIRVIQCVSGETPGTVFENLRIRNGIATTGGGMYIDQSSPTLSNCAFTGNSAEDGGGMYNHQGSPILSDCVFLGNSAEFGSGIYNDIASSPTLIDCRFTGNTARLRGGGMCNTSSSDPTLVRCMFTANDASNQGGGGMFSDETSTPTLTASLLCGNVGGNLYGGWVDEGANCIRLVCDDGDGDGRPDCGNQDSDLELGVPGEYDSIALAIDAAAPGAVITVESGIFTPRATIDTVGKSITIRGTLDGNGKPATIIDGGGMIRVLQCVSGESSDTVFENLTIRDGLAGETIEYATAGGGMYVRQSSPTLANCTFIGSSAQQGGGMYIREGSPTLTDCTFIGNAAGYGGGMYNRQGAPTLSDCVFLENSSGANGGGMYNVNESGLLLNECTFMSNSAGSRGGGMYSLQGSPTLRNCAFRENSGESAGGINNADGSMIMSGCTICENGGGNISGSWVDEGGNCLAYSCDDQDGDGLPDECADDGVATLLVPSQFASIEDAVEAAGYGDVVLVEAGVYFPSRTIDPGGKPITIRGAIDDEGLPVTVIDGGGNMRLIRCVTGESADTVFENLVIRNGSGPDLGYGSGMYNFYSSPTLRNCVFTGNSANTGGGVFNHHSSPTLTGCVFTGNTASYRGGGMFNGNSSDPVLIDCTLTGNFAASGGGMYNFGTSNPVLTNCVVCGNSPDQLVGPWADDCSSCVTASCEDCQLPVEPCPTDLVQNCITDADDLEAFLARWGACGIEDCVGDFNDDGRVDGADLGILFSVWGTCQ